MTCPVRDAAAEGLAGLKNKEVAIDQRCEEMLLDCVNLNCVVCTKRKAIYKFRIKLLKLFMKHASFLWPVITENGISSEHKILQ